MRGYFGIGVEGISKGANLGNLVRSTHAFGGSFFFTIAPNVAMEEIRVSDTAASALHMPFYVYENPKKMMLPRGCALVGVEFLPDAVDLPSFHHPLQAAYVLGPEMGSLSPEMLALCDHVIKIPMKFCVNVGVAGALVMYDRLISLGRHAPRPVRPGGPTEDLEMQPFGSHRRLSRRALKSQEK
ncbi:MAG: RNA methyltransferase [Rhodospirillales bacterium]|nr:RNA methyltransferase [Alphaproteobacteria bacterium]MCB9986924.1 RNA methyltransferase [Rhodospirillales bacterium]USO08578.1 MAG: RNA methyltransferase [Rhodospirillales bacterium]